MKATGPSVLETELGATPPTGLSSLSAEQQDDLAAAIKDAKRRHAQALAEAGENALSLIPRLLRGPVRRMFG
jgi:hypothetical protein